MTPPNLPAGPGQGLALPLVAALLFAVAHTWPPGVYSNQNQYLLHGRARAGVGDLGTDWLATTADPTPVFSLGVEWGYRAAGHTPVELAFLVVLVAYFVGLWAVARAVPGGPATAAGRAALAAGLVAVHAAAARVGSVWLTGVDYPWYLQAGVANQYLVGPGLQPSAFGVLLLLGVAASARGRPVLAGALAAGAGVVHSTYLLPAGLLVGGMLAGLWRAGRPRAAVLTGAVALAGVLPVVAYTLRTFGPTDPGAFAEAQAVLAWVRIPHHADPGRWFDQVAALQLLWAVAGLLLLRPTPLFVPLGLAAAGGLALAAAAVGTGSPTLALVFPWRVSAVLVPVATAAALARAAGWAERAVPARALAGLAAGVAAGAAAGGVWVMAAGLGYQESAAEAGLLEFVAGARRPGDVYLLPADAPKPPAGKGTGSATFVPVRQTGRPAVFELQRFRLATGAAAYVDFKSVPYKDADVLEWRRRVANAGRWYAAPDWDASGALAEAAAEGVTHVVVPAGTAARSRRLEPVYEDPAYRVLRVVRP